MTDSLPRLRRFLSELKRRKVYRVAVSYAVVGFVLIEAADLILVRLGLPPWTVTFVIVLVVVGFPLALILAWAFEMTPEGVRRTPAASEETGAGAPSRTGQSGLVVKVLVGLGLLGAAAAGGWYLTAGGGETEPAGEDRSIAVLPFDNLSGTEEAEPFVNGIHDDLLTRLSNISGLEVISRTSVLPYRETELGLPAIADSLGVAWIVEGGVQQAGDQVQVNAQLIQAEEDVHRWAETYQRELTTENLFAVQSELTKKIARSLEAELTPEETERVERRPTEDLDAYRLYVQGRSRLDTRTEGGIRRAVTYFQRAIQLDSTYALAWTGLADAWGLQGYYGYGAPPPPSDRREAIRRALEADPDLAEAHASLGLFHMERLEGPAALGALQRALEVRPGYAQARHWLAYTQLALGRPDEAVEQGAIAAELDPHFAAVHDLLAEAQLAAGDPEEALGSATRAERLQPGYGTVHAVKGLVLYHLDRPKDALGSLHEALSLMPEGQGGQVAGVRAMLAVTRTAAGDTAGAREEGERLSEEGAHPFWRGLVSAALGERDRAFELFGSAERWPAWPTFHARYFFPGILGPMRDDPRYEQMIREINQSWGLNPDGSLPDSVDVSSEAEPDD